MIASLRGTVVSVEGDRATVETGGVGFSVQAPATLLATLSRSVGSEVFVHTYLHVRDDALQLFGFASSREREFFLTLIGVSGVGPKVGLAILSAYPVEQLETAVMRGDTKRFEAIPGIGKKLAQRLMIELKDK
ncbi:MAG TPA: Holliday junction branch migration protein RuvA, partial [Thermoleophilia bacterium]|nr:Holliday junction branch migration protein RuvA [Thermoleophilia bacterium]